MFENLVDVFHDTNCLVEIYPRNEIYVNYALFDPKEISIIVSCQLPKGKYYTAKLIPYVTAENYVRCLSQASYLLAELAIKKGILAVDINAQDFLKAAINFELYYRHLAMTFHKKVKRDQEFKLKLTLPNIREIKKLTQDFILFTFKNKKTVISGELSFVYVKKENQ